MESDSCGPSVGSILRGGASISAPRSLVRTRHPRPGRTIYPSGRLRRLATISLVSRNNPCPCGSGKKYKRCCIDREPELVRKAQVADVLLGLATMFPLLRPECPEFDAWLEAQDASQMSETMVEAGESQLPETERERIAHEHARDFPELWRSLVHDLGEAEAEQLVLFGAIVAALREARTLDPNVLELIEEQGDELREDPAEMLALVVEPTDVWSIAEATAMNEAFECIPDSFDEVYEVLWDAALRLELSRSWSERHERRLSRLVRRLHGQLKLVESAAARELLHDACVAFERDEHVRRRLAAMLLADLVDALPPAEMSQTLAA
jgi:SEC-C motif